VAGLRRSAALPRRRVRITRDSPPSSRSQPADNSGCPLDRLEDVPLLLDHDPARRVGDVTRLFRMNNWWCVEMVLDSHRHRLGCVGIDMLSAHTNHGVSLGAQVHHEQPAGLLAGARWIRIAELEEVSLTRHPA
jgi:hypothetical protein